jgi:hypothetical protein
LLGELALGLTDRVVAAPDPAGGLGVLRAPAVISSRRSFFLVNDGCWWA